MGVGGVRQAVLDGTPSYTPLRVPGVSVRLWSAREKFVPAEIQDHVLRGGCRTEWMENIRDEASKGRRGQVGRRASSLKSRPGG